MQTLASLLQLFRKASGISVAKMCEDCGISHATWEDIEKGKDMKQSTFLVFLDHLFYNADRKPNYLVLLKTIILAELNDEYVVAKRISKHEYPLPSMSDCIFGFDPDPNWYNDEKTMQVIEELKELIQARKEEHKAEKEKLKAEIKKEKAETKKLREEIKKLKAEKKNGN
ncbi:MAG: helix-turn-helix transcriptional regulator [Bacteroidales bacterium]|nr:helix-turn-helix transcriptional regulator [Bacteroidales bacterium]